MRHGRNHKQARVILYDLRQDRLGSSAAVRRAGPSRRLWGWGAMKASTETIACRDGFADERAQVAMYASLSRVIEGAPVENKMRVFAMIARTTAADTAAYRQQMIDDLWYVAEDIGLIAMTGTAAVQNTLVVAFAGSAL
jgi:hypothetical protein